MGHPKNKVGELILNEGKRATPYGSAKVSWRGLPLMKAVFGLKGVIIPVTAAHDYGGIQIASLPNTNMLISGFMVDAVGTLTTGLVSTTLAFGLGSAINGATPLATTAIDYMDSTAATGASNTATMKGHTFDNASPALVFKDAASNLGLFFNITIACSADSTLTFTSGGVTMFYHDLGEVS